MAGAEGRARRHEERPLLHVLTPMAHVASHLGGEPEQRRVGPSVARLDLDDGVGALGQRRPCHDAHGVARRQDVAPGVARGDVAVDGDGHGRVRAGGHEIGSAHGIPVHGRVGEQGQVDPRRRVLGQHETQRLPDRHGPRRKGRQQGEDGVPVVGDAAQLTHR